VRRTFGSETFDLFLKEYAIRRGRPDRMRKKRESIDSVLLKRVRSGLRELFWGDRLVLVKCIPKSPTFKTEKAVHNFLAPGG